MKVAAFLLLSLLGLVLVESSLGGLCDIPAWLIEKVNSIEPLQVRLKATEEEVTKQRAEINSLKKAAPQVAFSVSLAQSDYVYRGPPAANEKVLVFKTVFANFGNGYDSNTGFFTAPVSGYYFFTFSTYDYNVYPSGAYMVKNGVLQISTYEHKTVDGSDSSSNSAVFLLAAGDNVHVELWDGARVMDNANHHTTFSGFLLYSTN